MEGRRHRLCDASDLYRFFGMVRDLLLWMNDMVRQMNTQEKPRDVSGVELLMNNHQSLKAEVRKGENPAFGLGWLYWIISWENLYTLPFCLMLTYR